MRASIQDRKKGFLRHSVQDGQPLFSDLVCVNHPTGAQAHPPRKPSATAPKTNINDIGRQTH